MYLMKTLFNSISPSAWLLMIFLSVIFILFPQIDIYFTNLFYTEGEGFFYLHSLPEFFLYKSVRYVLIVGYVLILFIWLYNRFTKKNIFDFTGKKLLYVLLVLILGSGLIVNALLKEHWGRARPSQTTNFGGDLHFTPAFVLSDQKGNSFSSGHTSGAFALLAFVMLAKRRKAFWMTLVILYGSAVSMARIVAGGHFLSDVFVSFFIMYITSKMLYYLMFERKF